MNASVPVLVVGGFLGSGKTTLVRHLLADAQARGLRMAVISNEFGALGIDAALIGNGASRMVELAGGCVCCTLSDELVETLIEIRTKVDPDRIVIECSGLALPFDTQLHLYRPGVREWIGDEACLVVVDAERWDESDELFAEQLQSADLAVLNKCDLVSNETLIHAKNRIYTIANDVPIIEVIHGRVSLGIAFPDAPADQTAATRHLPASQDASTHDHDHASHRHESAHSHQAWESFEVAFASPTDEITVASTIRSLGAVRAKGFVQTAEGPRVVQGVGRRLELVETTNIQPALLGRVVIIRRIPPKRG